MTTKKQPIDWRIVVTGLVCLTVLEMFALWRGFNGTLLTVVLAAIAGVVGIVIPNPLKK